MISCMLLVMKKCHSPTSRITIFTTFMVRIDTVRNSKASCFLFVKSPMQDSMAPPIPTTMFWNKRQKICIYYYYYYYYYKTLGCAKWWGRELITPNNLPLFYKSHKFLSFCSYLSHVPFGCLATITGKSAWSYRRPPSFHCSSTVPCINKSLFVTTAVIQSWPTERDLYCLLQLCHNK